MIKRVLLLMTSVAVVWSTAVFAKQLTITNEMKNGVIEQNWSSSDQSDAQTVKFTNEAVNTVNLAITVLPWDYSTGKPLTGVDLQGCDDITHIDINSTVMCSIATGETVSWSTDYNDDLIAKGNFVSS